MPGIVKVKVLEGRNLPVMDKSADTTDAYVEIKLGNITYKTDVCRKSLNPQWNSEWYKFEMDDAELQDEPLQVRLMDHDTYSANDMIGKVYFNLNPLLLNNANETRYTMLKSSHSASPGPGCISGWFPVYDTIHGLRGEINLIIRLELFPDLNKYRQSSCGVHVFNCSMIPYGFYTEHIYGFVEELVVEDDPEYQWIEKIRTPRASNEARQAMFYKMSGEVQRKIGLKVIDSGGNAIIGYKQYFDLEGETGGVVVRGIGTAVKLSRCKQLDTVSGRPSLKYQIPSLTITDAFANTSFQSDDCSIISGSSQSDNYLSDVPNDRWSLCSFGSRTSCQSRYTSIETLLDQKNRKPIAKGSKFLNVARYFTSSKMKRTFSRKKKQKSLHALRKFSIIEEYKQKSNANIGSEIDEMIEESLNLSNFSTSKASLKRISTVEEPISCQIFENENSSRNQYFDLSGPHINLKQKDDEIFELEDVVRDKKNEENEKLLLADDMELKIIEKIEACMISEKCVDEESKEVESFEKSISSDLESLISQKLNRCLTPPISEMTPYCMTPPLRDMNSVNPLIEKELKKVKSVEFGKSFLKKLKRQHIDHYPISDSPEIKKLIEWNEEHKQNTSNSVESNKTIFHKEPVNIKKDKRPRSISECLSDENPCSFDFNDLWEFNQSSPVNSSNNSEFTFFNEKNSGFPVTTADDISNILPQALTPSCLLMHANNSDRNASECDKDLDENVSNTPKRESVSSVDHLTKKRPSLPDTSAIVSKNFDINKDCDSTPSNVTVYNMGSNIIHKENVELMEYPFLTLSIYPDDFIVHLGGTVSVRSVKLLARISNIEEPETRDAWWRELRIEIKSHMKALACNVVLNYTESTAICDDVCVLSATGTAAIVKIYDGSSPSLSDYLLRSTNPKLTDKDNEVFMTKEKVPTENASSEEINCSIYHIPYRKASLPLSVKIKMCAICKKGFVTDVLLVTIEPFDKMPVIGQAAFIHASVCRLKRDSKSELNARDISDCLPFLEYKLNRQLINKLRVKGMNAIFGLNVQVSIGEKMVSAYATGTAVLLSVLPSPSEVTIAGWAPTQSSASNKKLADARKLLEDTVKKNKIHYQLLEAIPEVVKTSGYEAAGQDYYPDIQYSAGSKQTCAIEIEDEDNVDAVTQLIDPNPPQGFLVSATEKIIFGSLPYIPKKNIQFFTQVYRYRIPNYSTTNFNKLFYKIVQSLYMKVHNRIPCSLNRVSFKMDIPEPDELQIRIIGMALALKESEKALESISTSCSSVSELSDDLVLNSNTEKDLEQIDALCTFTPRKQITKKRNEPHDNEIHITSLSYIPGANINSYLGNLNFVFIRESTMVKEPTGVVNNFVNSFMSDVTLMVKSHAAGIGGNAVVNFFVNECLLITHSHKNQGQCLINVGGDVVRYVPKNYRMDL